MPTESPADRRTRFIAKLLTTGLLVWEETADSDTFQVTLDSFVVQIGRKWNDDVGENRYQVSLFNKSGKLLEEIYPRNVDTMALHQLTGHGADSAFQSLFESARRQALNVDESLDAAMKEIEKQAPF